MSTSFTAVASTKDAFSGVAGMFLAADQLSEYAATAKALGRTV